MARIDDYRTAVELGKKELKDKNCHLLAKRCGTFFTKGRSQFMHLPFLNQEIKITWPKLEFSFLDSDKEVSLQQQVLLLHYLAGANGLPLASQWIAYQEVPDGKFYLDAFLRRAKNPMVQTFGTKPDLLVKLARTLYKADDFDQGDYSVVLQALPSIPVVLILWEGDDDFTPEGTILFDKNIQNILSAEDIAWLAGMVVYPLIGMSFQDEYKTV